VIIIQRMKKPSFSLEVLCLVYTILDDTISINVGMLFVHIRPHGFCYLSFVKFISRIDVGYIIN
jgi:hypothetical protein